MLTPTPTRSATPTPTPKPPWQFGSATLSIPAAGVNQSITPYTQADIDANGGVEPPDMAAISWDTTIPGSKLSVTTTNTIYLYGHWWIEPAVFNDVWKLQPGAAASITSTAADGSVEVLDFVMNEPTFTVMKPDFDSDARVTPVDRCRLVVVSCYRPDGYDPQSKTVESVVAIFQRPACG